MFAEKGGCDIQIWEPINTPEIITDANKVKKFLVNYRGYPTSYGEWYKPKKFMDSERQLVSNSSEFELLNMNKKTMNVSQLIIRRPLLEHAGEYTFVVSNNLCNKSKNYKLIVNGNHNSKF